MKTMKKQLPTGNFQELSKEETRQVEGGSWFSCAFNAIVTVFEAVETAIRNIFNLPPNPNPGRWPNDTPNPWRRGV